MCLLIVIQGVDPEFPVLVASNRDEQRDRKAAPPGLYVGERMRMLSPRDRVGGGTWLAINQQGMFAGLTNIAGAPHEDLPTTRGVLPHLALDQEDLAGAERAVREAVTEQRFNPFQLLVSDGRRSQVMLHLNGKLQETETDQSVLVVSNEHRLGQLQIPGLEHALLDGMSATDRLAALRPLLLDEGERSGHRILKKGDSEYGTVSSALIAVPGEDPRRLIWEYAAGSPDQVEYRSYGNLGKRLLPAPG